MSNQPGWLFPPHQTAAALMSCRTVLPVHGDNFMGILNAKLKMTLGSQSLEYQVQFLPVTFTGCVVLSSTLFQTIISSERKWQVFSIFLSTEFVIVQCCILCESVWQIEKLIKTYATEVGYKSWLKNRLQSSSYPWLLFFCVSVY